MANALAMARSFHSWLARIEMNESSEFVSRKLPSVYPTNPRDLIPITHNLCESLEGTEYYQRAVYWRKIFESFVATELDEGIKTWTMSMLKKLFVPPPPAGKLPSDPILLRAIRTARDGLARMWNDHVELRRRKFPTYSLLHNYFRQNQLDIMSRALHLTGVGDDSDLNPENKQRWAWKWRCWAFAFPVHFNAILRAIGNWLSTGTATVEYVAAFIWALLSMLCYGAEILYGKAVARGIFK